MQHRTQCATHTLQENLIGNAAAERTVPFKVDVWISSTIRDDLFWIEFGGGRCVRREGRVYAGVSCQWVSIVLWYFCGWCSFEAKRKVSYERRKRRKNITDLCEIRWKSLSIVLISWVLVLRERHGKRSTRIKWFLSSLKPLTNGISTGSDDFVKEYVYKVFIRPFRTNGSLAESGQPNSPEEQRRYSFTFTPIKHRRPDIESFDLQDEGKFHWTAVQCHAPVLPHTLYADIERWCLGKCQFNGFSHSSLMFSVNEASSSLRLLILQSHFIKHMPRNLLLIFFHRYTRMTKPCSCDWSDSRIETRLPFGVKADKGAIRSSTCREERPFHWHASIWL